MKEQVLEKGTVNKATVKKEVSQAIAAEKKEAKAVAEKQAVEKNATEKNAVEKKAVEKKAVEKKATEKKTAKATKAGKKEIFVQFGNREIAVSEIQKKVEEAYKKEGQGKKAEDDVRVYVKPEENMIYYVVNDSYASGINLFD